MPDWLKDWGTLVIAAFGAVTGGSSLLINWLNRRDAQRREAADRKAKEPWAELAFGPAAAIRTVLVGVHNPSGRNLTLTEVALVSPPGWAIVLDAPRPPDLNDDFGYSPARTVALTGLSADIDWAVGTPPPGTTLASRSHLDLCPIMETDGTPSASADAKSIVVEIRLSGTWISANDDPIVLTARKTMTP